MDATSPTPHRENLESGHDFEFGIACLFERVVQRLEEALTENGWVCSQSDVANRLDQMLLDLRHWNQDIRNHKDNVLGRVEEEGGELAKTIMICLLGIASGFEQLRNFFDNDQHGQRYGGIFFNQHLMYPL